MVVITLLSFITGFLCCFVGGWHVWIKAAKNPGFWEGFFTSAFAKPGIIKDTAVRVLNQALQRDLDNFK